MLNFGTGNFNDPDGVGIYTVHVLNLKYMYCICELSSARQQITGLEASLPPPRVPCDPLVPFSEPMPDEAKKSKSQFKPLSCLSSIHFTLPLL